MEHGGIVLPADLGLGGAADMAGVCDSPISPRIRCGRSNNREHGGRLPRLHGIQNRARNRTRSGAEQRARTTAVTILAAAQAHPVCSRMASTVGIIRLGLRREPAAFSDHPPPNVVWTP